MQGLSNLQMQSNQNHYQHLQYGNNCGQIVSPYYHANQEKNQQNNVQEGTFLERDNHSKERSLKRNNNVSKQKSSEKASFNKSTPQFFQLSQNEQPICFQAIHSNNNINSSNNITNIGSIQSNPKEKEKISQIQKIYNNNIRSRNNLHKSPNNFYNTHSNTFFNAGNINGIVSNQKQDLNIQNNGASDSQKRYMTNRLSQSPSEDSSQFQQQQFQSITQQQKRQQLLKTPQQNPSQLASFQKENSNLASLYSREFKGRQQPFNRNSISVLKNEVLMTPAPSKQVQNNSNHQKIPLQSNVPSAFFSQDNSSNKFYQTEPNFNKKQAIKMLPYSKQAPSKPQLVPIEDLIGTENLITSGQVGRKYFSTVAQPIATNQFFSAALSPSSQMFSSQNQKLALLNPTQIGSFPKNKLDGKQSQIPMNNERELDRNFDDYPLSKYHQIVMNDSDFQFEEKNRTLESKQRVQTPKLLSLEESKPSRQLDSVETQQLYNYEIEIDSSLTSFKKKKDHKKDKNYDHIEVNNNQTETKEFGYQSTYVNEKLKNKKQLEIIEQQFNEDEIKILPLELIQQVQKISESRPKTSEGGRRKRGLRQALREREEKKQKELAAKQDEQDQQLMSKNSDSQNKQEDSKEDEILKASPKQLDFSPLKTNCEEEDGRWFNQKQNQAEEEFDEEEEDYGLYNQDQRKDQHQFRTQANFYRPQKDNFSSTFYPAQNQNFRSTVNEGFGISEENKTPSKYKGKQINNPNMMKSNAVLNEDLPIEVHVKEDDKEYIYQQRENKQKIIIKNKKIDSNNTEGHKIIIRHNKSAAGPKRVPKQQEKLQQINEDESESTIKNIKHQDDVVERIIVPFKTGLDNEFIHLFADQQPFS